MPGVGRLDGDGELLHRGARAVGGHGRPAQIPGPAVFRAPLAGLPVHDELDAAKVRDGP